MSNLKETFDVKCIQVMATIRLPLISLSLSHQETPHRSILHRMITMGEG